MMAWVTLLVEFQQVFVLCLLVRRSTFDVTIANSTMQRSQMLQALAVVAPAILLFAFNVQANRPHRNETTTEVY